MIYVMSDLHGMYDKYIQMLEQIHFTQQDTLYLLGDVIDRGPDAIKILQDMMRRPNVIGICGNHEWMMVECMDILYQEITERFVDETDEEMLLKLSDWINNGALSTIQKFQALDRKEQREIMDYLMEFQAYEEVWMNDKKYLLVHAGLRSFHENRSIEDYDIHELVWERPNWKKGYFQDSNTYVVVGHTPTLSITGKPQIYHGHNIIAIDCGACFKQGRLACLCLDTMEEFYV